MKKLEECDEEIVRELVNLEKTGFHRGFCAKTRQELDQLKQDEDQILARYHKLSRHRCRRLEIEVLNRLAVDPEAPFMVRESAQQGLERLHTVRKAGQKEVDNVLTARKKELAKQLVLLISPQLVVEIPKVLEQGLAEKATIEQLEGAIKGVNKDNVKAKKGCLHIDIASLNVVWSGPNVSTH